MRIILTIIHEIPTKNNDKHEIFICPYLYAIVPKKFVPIKYPIESGIKTVPNCHFFGFKCSISHIGKHGSNIAIVDVDNHIAITITITILFCKIGFHLCLSGSIIILNKTK